MENKEIKVGDIFLGIFNHPNPCIFNHPNPCMFIILDEIKEHQGFKTYNINTGVKNWDSITAFNNSKLYTKLT